MNREEMLQVFRELNEELRHLDEKLELIVVGYSAIILHGGNLRGTEDIDVFSNRFTRLLQTHYIQLLDEHYFHFHPEYRNRLHPCGVSLTHLNLFYADPHDIFLLKLDAYRDKDVKDMRHLLDSGMVSVSKLDSMFEEWNRYWYADNKEMTRNYLQVKGESNGTTS